MVRSHHRWRRISYFSKGKGVWVMSKACQKFLTKQLSKGGHNAYVAMLLLGASDSQGRELLKRFTYETIRENVAVFNRAS